MKRKAGHKASNDANSPREGEDNLSPAVKNPKEHFEIHSDHDPGVSLRPSNNESHDIKQTVPGFTDSQGFHEGETPPYSWEKAAHEGIDWALEMGEAGLTQGFSG